jgi:hypothetical protein
VVHARNATYAGYVVERSSRDCRLSVCSAMMSSQLKFSVIPNGHVPPLLPKARSLVFIASDLGSASREPSYPIGRWNVYCAKAFTMVDSRCSCRDGGAGVGNEADVTVAKLSCIEGISLLNKGSGDHKS